MRVKFENGTKDVPMTEVTAENYIVPKGEEGLYHVVQEQKMFDPKTGKQLSKPVLQKYNDKVWPKQQRTLLSWGYALTIVHDPSQYNSRRDAERQQEAAEKRRIAMELEQQRREEERARIKEEIAAEIRAELLAEMKQQKTPKEKKSNK